MNRDKNNQVRLGLESLETRETPAHLADAGISEVVLPTNASHGAPGIQTAQEVPANEVGHGYKKIIMTVD